MSRRDFSIKLNEELDGLGFPLEDHDRIEALAKVLKINTFQAASILHGDILPNQEVIGKISTELQINGQWLLDKAKH